jgi:transporter family-2 protein
VPIRPLPACRFSSPDQLNKVGAGPFAGLTITANILMCLVIDKFGWFGMDIHPLNGWRMLGAALMVAGIALIARF